MAAAIVARPRARRGARTHGAGRLLLSPGNAWFTVGPAAVLALAGSPGPAEAGVAAAGRDARRPDRHRLRRSPSLWQRLTTRAPLADAARRGVHGLRVDVALAPVGLLAALSIDESPVVPDADDPAVRRARRVRERAAYAPRAAHRAQRRLSRHRDGARRGRRRRRRLHGHAHARRRRALARGRRPARPGRPSAGATSSSARCCTTSARSRSRTRSSTSPARSTTPSGR